MKQAVSLTLVALAALLAGTGLAGCSTAPSNSEDSPGINDSPAAGPGGDDVTPASTVELQKQAQYAEWISSARRYYTQRYDDLAMRDLEKALTLYPKKPAGTKLHLQIRARQGDHEAMAKLVAQEADALRQIRRDKAIRELEATFELAKAALKDEHDYTKAIKGFNKAATILEDNALTELRDEAMAAKMEAIRSGIVRLSGEARTGRAKQQAADAMTARERSQALIQKALDQDKARRQREIKRLEGNVTDYQKSAQYREALHTLDRLIEKDPINNAYREQRGQIRALAVRAAEAKARTNIRRAKEVRLLKMKEVGIPYGGRNLLNFPDAVTWRKISGRKRNVTVRHSGPRTNAEDARTRKLLSEIMIRDFAVSGSGDSAPTITDVIEKLKKDSGFDRYEELHKQRPLLGLRFEPGLQDVSQSAFEIKFRQFRLAGEHPLDEVLRHIVQHANLGYTIRNGHVVITDSETQSSDLVVQVYDVADLVTPVVDFIGPIVTQSDDSEDDQDLSDTGVDDTGGTDENEIEFEASAQSEKINPVLSMSMDRLIRSIRGTIQQDSWSSIDEEDIDLNDSSGKGTISPNKKFDLIINQTPEIHKEIEDHLAKLRMLSGVLVNIELKVITLDDDFLRDVGVDLTNLGSALISGVTSGITGDPRRTEFLGGSPGSILVSAKSRLVSSNINTVSLAQVTRLESTGGLNLAGQILDDFSVRAVLTAVKKTNRAHVLTSPSITTLNTQRAFLSVGTFESFIQDTTPRPGGDVVVDEPTIGKIGTFTVLDVRPIVSANRRFVTLTLRPTIITRLPFGQANVTRDITGGGTASSPIQLPNTIEQVIRTTVRVPDGGTVLIGGLREVSEQDGTQETPILGRLPILGALFRRKAEAVQRREIIILLTCRIIVLSEEAAKH